MPSDAVSPITVSSLHTAAAVEASFKGVFQSSAVTRHRRAKMRKKVCKIGVRFPEKPPPPSHQAFLFMYFF
jgi:hypothetical protein